MFPKGSPQRFDLEGFMSFKEGDGKEFEWTVFVTLMQLGFKGVRPPKCGTDGGVDMLLESNEPLLFTLRWVVQCKESYIDGPAVDRLWGTMYRQKAQMGILVTNGIAAKKCHTYAKKKFDNRIKIVEGDAWKALEEQSQVRVWSLIHGLKN